jgi:Raf kinase inhibitor-like YbhB/YbcL family protein
VPLAKDRDETRAAVAIAVRSASIAPGAAIPVRHSEYADGVSPSLAWSAVEGARSYAIVMEDPDAKPVTPFVHWLAWNIPAAVTHLPEGVQEHQRLTEPEGMLQGTTSRGAPGYYGPRPPPMDPPHRYHLQVFALDTMLQVAPGATATSCSPRCAATCWPRANWSAPFSSRPSRSSERCRARGTGPRHRFGNAQAITWSPALVPSEPWPPATASTYCRPSAPV